MSLPLQRKLHKYSAFSCYGTIDANICNHSIASLALVRNNSTRLLFCSKIHAFSQTPAQPSTDQHSFHTWSAATYQWHPSCPVGDLENRYECSLHSTRMTTARILRHLSFPCAQQNTILWSNKATRALDTVYCKGKVEESKAPLSTLKGTDRKEKKALLLSPQQHWC